MNLLWIFTPLAFLIFWVCFELVAHAAIVHGAVAENGVIEIIQAVVLCVGIFAAGRKLYQLDIRKYPFLTAWFGSALLGCTYIAGEEISWGQWFFYWETPAGWAEINDQRETNLHNTSSWLDQKPRILLELGIVMSGLVLPFLRRVKKEWIPGWLAVLLPVRQASFLALMYVGVKLLDMIPNVFGAPLFARGSEIIEFFIYYYIASYIVAFRLSPEFKRCKVAEEGAGTC